MLEVCQLSLSPTHFNNSPLPPKKTTLHFSPKEKVQNWEMGGDFRMASPPAANQCSPQVACAATLGNPFFQSSSVEGESTVGLNAGRTRFPFACSALEISCLPSPLDGATCFSHTYLSAGPRQEALLCKDRSPQLKSTNRAKAAPGKACF